MMIIRHPKTLCGIDEDGTGWNLETILGLGIGIILYLIVLYFFSFTSSPI